MKFMTIYGLDKGQYKQKKVFEEILKENKYYRNWKLLCPIKIV